MEWKSDNLKARRNYASERQNIANTNRGILSNLHSKLGELEFAKDKNNALSIQNAFNEGLGMIEQEKQNQFEQNQLLFSQKQSDATREAKAQYLESSGLNAAWNALSDEEKKPYANILNWMEKNRNGQFQEYLNIKGHVAEQAVKDLYKPKGTLLSTLLKNISWG